MPRVRYSHTIIGCLTPAPECRSLRGPGRLSMADVRELTYGEAVKEAIAEEMRRDPRVFLIGEDVAEAGHPFKTLVGLVQEFGTAAHHRHADLRARLRRHRRGRGHDRHAADRGRDVRRLHHADHGPDGQPGRQGPLHVGRQDQGADRLPHHAGRHAPLRRAALAVAARLGEPRPRPQGGAALRPLRGQGTDEDRHPRRQPGGDLRGQDDVPREGPGPRRGLHDSVRRRRGQA